MAAANQQARRWTQFSLRALLRLTSILAIVLAVAMSVYRFRERQAAERARQAERTRLVLEQTAKEVESLCRKLQRSPKDERELDSLLGKPLPVVNDHGVEKQVIYYANDETSFCLVVAGWYDLVYDSTKPNSGWHERDW
jgi:hypothetical protein